MPAAHHLTVDAQTEDRPDGPELTALDALTTHAATLRP